MAKNTVKNEGALSADTRKIINDNFRDVAVCTTTFSATSGTTGTTLTDVPGLITATLDPGQYTFRAVLGVVSTINSGLKIAFKQGTASMVSAIEYDARAYGASSVAASRGTTTTDQTSIVAATAAYVHVLIEGTVTIAAAGTLQLQAAQNASHADTTSVYLGSFIEFEKV